VSGSASGGRKVTQKTPIIFELVSMVHVGSFSIC
jgi:hypothetical protein